MITLALEEQGWGAGPDWPKLVDQALRAAIAETPYADLAEVDREVEVSVTLGDDAAVQTLNKAWRNKDKPTNVLSFPMTSPEEMDDLPDGAEAMLGDIILAHGVCSREAAEKSITIADHATHLVVHGMLHLLGYDHMSEGEAEAMEAMEQRALARLGIADPYADMGSLS
jgi:probable rRNA maturation factor